MEGGEHYGSQENSKEGRKEDREEGGKEGSKEDREEAPVVFVHSIPKEKQKFVYIGKPNFAFGLEFKEIEASFYFSNPEKAEQFDVKKNYKITIEEI